MSHTPEPWHVHVGHNGPGWTIACHRGARLNAVAEVDRHAWYDAGESMANRDRIVACVNACAGIADPADAIAKARDALRVLVREWDLGREPTANDWSEARDAIAALGEP